MNKKRYDYWKNKYLDFLKDFKTKKGKLEYLEDLRFSINMIDVWDEEDKVAINVIDDLIKELESGENDN